VSMKAIRDRYNVPARRGKLVRFRGEPSAIRSADGHRLWLTDLATMCRVGPCHPVWKMDYLDGVDHGAAYVARVEAFIASLDRRAIASTRKEQHHG
jgi:hypothetical protein